MMPVEKARRIANDKLSTAIEPLINSDSQELDEEKFIQRMKQIKVEILEETGYEVDTFYVNPLGFGFYEVTTTFTTGEKLIPAPMIHVN